MNTQDICQPAALNKPANRLLVGACLLLAVNVLLAFNYVREHDQSTVLVALTKDGRVMNLKQLQSKNMRRIKLIQSLFNQTEGPHAKSSKD